MSAESDEQRAASGEETPVETVETADEPSGEQAVTASRNEQSEASGEEKPPTDSPGEQTDKPETVKPGEQAASRRDEQQLHDSPSRDKKPKYFWRQ